MRSGLTCPGRRDTLRLLALPRAPRFTRFSLPASGLATTLVLLGAGASAADGSAADGSAADGSAADGSAIPSSPLRELSDYETESLNFALAEIDGRLDPGPEGKRIEAIEVVTLEVIERRDPAPRFLNWFHVTTQKSIIRREVLLAVGSPYRQDLASETERNLREFAQFSVVLVQPVEGSTPDTVRVLVVTKDVWSLRVSWEPTFYNGRLTSIRLSPAESNLLGTTQIVSGHVSLDANNYWLGATYYTPRIGGSRINASFSANAAFDCSTGNVEGGSGVLDYGQPLYSTRTKWSWRVRSTYYNAIVRPRAGREDAICSSTGPDVISVVPQAEAADTLDTQRDVLLVPYIYRAEQLRSQLVFTRSLFVRNKIDLSFGAEADRQAYTLLDEYFERTRAGVDRWDDAQQCWLSPGAGDDCSHRFQAEEYPVTDRPEDRAAARTSLQGVTSVNDTRVSPYVQLHAYEASYLRTLNLNTLGLQEDVQLGHNVYLRLFPAFRPVSSRDLLGVFASAMYTWSFDDGFARVAGSTSTELAGRENDLHRPNPLRTQSTSEIQLHAFVSSPDLGVGRFVVGAAFADLPINYFRRYRSLGGSDRLRGYTPLAFEGRTLFVNNTEFRTKPVRLFSVLFGLSAFWDVGHAADGLDELEFRHGIGGGLRVLFPQLDRQVFRFDLGWPAQSDPAGSFTFTAGFRQAFEPPSLYPGSLLTQ